MPDGHDYRLLASETLFEGRVISLRKDTSLTSIILVVELTQTARFAAAPTFQYMPMFALAALYYWIICTILSVLQDRAEERFSRYVAA